MSENFLERWSRRKRDVAEQESTPETPTVVEDPARDLAGTPAAGESPAATNAEEPGFDLSQLPSLESITAETDIRAFLAPGVPAALRHAALRRAWSADPTIRDFIGLSENAWDFTAPDGVPGFGPIGSPEEVQRMLAQLMGGPPEAVEKTSSEPADDIPQASAAAKESVVPEPDTAVEMNQALQHAQQEQAGSDKTSDADETELLQHNKESTAVQQGETESQYAPISGRRSHGRALPE